MTPEAKFLKAVKKMPITPENKIAVSLRIDPDVLDWFKNSGEKWQTHMNRVLRLYMQIFIFDNRL